MQLSLFMDVLFPKVGRRKKREMKWEYSSAFLSLNREVIAITTLVDGKPDSRPYPFNEHETFAWLHFMSFMGSEGWELTGMYGNEYFFKRQAR